jgi:Tol biopolymer transport system component
MDMSNRSRLQTFCLLAFLFPVISKAQTPSRAAAGDVLAYCFYNPAASPGFEIYSINVDGTNSKKLMSSSIGLNHHEFSPDGNKIACVGYINMESTWSIHVFEADGTNLKRLTNTSGVFDGALSWSPDGSTIAFTRTFPTELSRGDEIWLMKADGSNQRYSGVKGFQPMWSSDGGRFVYSSSKSGNYEIYTSNTDGTNERRLTTNAADDSNPVWSPDGSQIAFSSDREGNLEIYVMKTDGTVLRRLTNNNVSDNMPRWSPDGQTIAFNSALAGGQHTEVFLMNADGTNIRRLTNTPGDAMSINPAWRPAVNTTSVEGHSGSGPSLIELHQNYPNPFNPSTTIRFTLARPAQVELELYDSLGRIVKALLNERTYSGSHSLTWDGTDSNGHRVASGLYLFRLTSGGAFQQQKALLLK